MLLFWISVSYALGCLNTAYYLLRLRTGADVRTLGSGNAGARNAGRVFGRLAFGLVLLLDVARGALAVGGAHQLGLGAFGAMAAALAVAAGHVWPIQLGFRGGKGAAVAAGALLVLDVGVALAAAGSFTLLLAWLRRLTPSGLLAIATVPAWALLLGRPPEIAGGLALIVAVVIGAHRRDLQVLFSRPDGQQQKPAAPSR